MYKNVGGISFHTPKQEDKIEITPIAQNFNGSRCVKGLTHDTWNFLVKNQKTKQKDRATKSG